MRPHRLRVSAFGAFAESQLVCFDDLEGLFLLHGETGAGKTTLLDAIAFALYGRVPGERGKAKRLRSDHASAGAVTEVELEATIGGRRLRITRKPEQERPKRSGTGMTKEPASVRFEELTDSGAWEVKSTRAGEADAEIADLMGMSAEQFFQVVLLPQGEFARFLHAGAEARGELLQKLFGTDRFRAVEEWLAERRRATAAEVAAASEAVDRLLARIAQAAGVPVPDAAPVGAIAPLSPDAAPIASSSSAPSSSPSAGDPAAWQATWAASLAESAAADRDGAAALAAERKQQLEVALAAQAGAKDLADRQRRRQEALRKRSALESAAPEIALLRVEADAASRAAEVAPVLDEADRAADAAATASAAQEQALAAIPAEVLARLPSPVSPPAGESADGAGEGTVSAVALRAAAEEQRAQFGRFDALRAVARQADDEDTRAKAARTRAARIDQALAARQAEAARHRDARPSAARARDDASESATALAAAQAAANLARRVATDSAALIKERRKLDRLREAHLAAREKALDLREEADRLHRARIDGMSAELAANLFDGFPCPVCGSLDHPDPVEPTFDPVSREQEEAANGAAKAAAAQADKAGQQVAAANAVIEELAKRLADAGFTPVPAAPVPAAPVPAAPGAATADPPAAQPDDAWTDLVALSAAAAQAEARADRLDAEAISLKAAAASLGDLQRALDVLDEAIAVGKAELEKLSEQRKAALAEAEAAERRAAEGREELRAQLGGAPGLDTALASARRAAGALTAAADAADEAARTTTERDDARLRAARAGATAGFGADAIEEARKAWRDAGWRGDAAKRISRHEADAQAVATQLADSDLDVVLDPPAPVAATAQAAAAARDSHDAAVDVLGRSRHTAAQLTELEPLLKKALADLKPKKERADEARQLADLAAGLGANQYRMTLSSFVLAARLEEVAQAASERLLTMTAGRYSLLHTDARRGGGRAGLGLLACDSWTGVDRDTSTLSGGETFLASLALALGLADVVTAESAGTPMEALFVDEGFGTLDEDTLDEVMNVLDSLREGGRIVGIVSHVTELRQRIPAQVHVRKGQHGSSVTVTAG
jgi:DNA repair protein SbcC/Rad50